MTAHGPVVVLGAGGQVGRALVQLLGKTAMDVVLAALERIKPSALINAAAYTLVDKAESEPEAAMQINARGPGALARWAKARNIPMIHYSTDYVFSGTTDAKTAARPWVETDKTAPINVYGKSKLEGEIRVGAQGGKFLIFRTSWVYDAAGKNFLNTMLRLGQERQSLKVVDDQVGAPTYAKDLAEATLHALTKASSHQTFPSGVYHLTNAGETSWYGFAREIFEKARALGIPLAVTDLQPIPSSAYPTPAPRPKNSRLSNAKFKSTFGIELRPWAPALAECLHEKSG
ncbi:MAG: dTDP-4-dehydrorhamnose reductase [Deltaproteobacteria bacterium]|nr:dTDP-4-dehydrorhamnose reductase [Deltaproteobacteria bacterium]